MVNFENLVNTLKKFNGTDLTVSLIGKLNGVFGLDNCRVMEFVGKTSKGINICNINNLLDGDNPITLIINEEDVLDYEIIECNGNEEIMVKMSNGEGLIIVGC